MFKKIIKETPSLEGLKPVALMEAVSVLREKRLHWRVRFLFGIMFLLSFSFAAFILYDILVFGLIWWLPLPIIIVSAIIGYLTARIYKFGLQKFNKVVTIARMDRTAVVIFILYIILRIITTPLLEDYYQNIHVVRGVFAATMLGVIGGRFLGVIQMINKLAKDK
ncbi:MAG TPA: hypothetical protein VJ103_00455 [Candidatus Paceibacterota bacterium]|nr:hypothetical protein [Candidatus Paceibacterota bacterium]